MCGPKGYGFLAVLVLNGESILAIQFLENVFTLLSWTGNVLWTSIEPHGYDIISIHSHSHILRHNLKQWDLVSPSFYTICIDWMPWISLACSSFSWSLEVAIDQHIHNKAAFSTAQDRKYCFPVQSKQCLQDNHMGGLPSPHVLTLDDFFDLCFRTVKFWFYQVHSTDFDKRTNCS